MDKATLHASREDYLEAILVLQKKLGMVRSVDVARQYSKSVPPGLEAMSIIVTSPLTFSSSLDVSTFLGTVLKIYAYSFPYFCKCGSNGNGTLSNPKASACARALSFRSATVTRLYMRMSRSASTFPHRPYPIKRLFAPHRLIVL